MPKPYRSRSRLMLDVLRAVRAEGVGQTTRLLLLANLSHPRLQEHLVHATERGWLVQVERDGRPGWHLTGQGLEVLHGLERIEESMQDFGLAL